MYTSPPEGLESCPELLKVGGSPQVRWRVFDSVPEVVAWDTKFPFEHLPNVQHPVHASRSGALVVVLSQQQR